MKKILLVAGVALILSLSFIADVATPVALAAPGKKGAAHTPREATQSEPKSTPSERHSRRTPGQELPAQAPTQRQTQTQASPNISAEEAESIALDTVGSGAVARTELKYPRHGVEYKVIIVAGDYKYDVHIDGSIGTVRSFKSSLIVKISPSAYNSGAAAAIDTDEAMDIAVSNAGGGIVTDCTLSYKHHLGALIYHIHVASGQYETCVEVDAVSGDILKFEQRYKP